MATTLPKRSELPQEQTWNLESVFPSDAAWEAAYTGISPEIAALGRYQGRLAESGATLLEALQTRDDLILRVARISLYAGMQLAGDTADARFTARDEQTGSLWARALAAASYFEPEILAIAPETRAALVQDTPGLAVYAHYFDTLDRQREHIRSAEVEDLLAQAQDVAGASYRIHMALEDADMTFGSIKDEDGNDVPLAQGNAWKYIGSTDRRVRQEAWEGYADGYLAVKNTMAATLIGAVKSDVFFARAHNYGSAFEAAMEQNHIPAEVFHNLIATFQRNLPTWHRYWEIRRRALGVDRLHGYDVYAPLTSKERDIPYATGIDMIAAGMAPLGEEYGTAMRRGLDAERWVDPLPNQGKGSGAFSSGVPGTHPFIMMNYDNTLGTVSTLAHELGHSLHSHFTWQHQPPIYSNYSMFVAETASNFNQALVRSHLLATETDPTFQLEVLAEAMGNFHRYLFVMPTLARFELFCHEQIEAGEGLSAEVMSAKMVELLREAFGPALEIDEARLGIFWAQFTHLFANFYVYQYATGISAAAALAKGVVEEGRPAADRYLQFLRAGASVYPIEALQLAGIDMSQPEPVERGFAVLADLVDRLDKLVGDGPAKP
ncbi:MAG: oligoendopeptidase F [Chloroflexota bacterium]|nr:oligoendopeptidase F [Chloroflexota bacterium]